MPSDSAFRSNAASRPLAPELETTLALAPGPDGPACLPRGTAVGRYLLLGCLGQGGMGVVYKAYDPELNRPVALKLLKAGDEATVLRDRLVREAQALARLSHPNVIAVHDVGTFDRDVFLAMEFVEGQTLHGWLAAKSRSRRAITEAFLAAGEGLAAAHRAGLVHRDFKPENVIVGDDGRVRVLDFGVARVAAGESAAPAEQESLSASSGPRRIDPEVSRGSRLDGALTHAGAAIGTPMFMAPEQHLGEAVDERADQFAFCVSLHRALTGEFPFAGRTLTDYRANVVAGNVREAPVPRWLRRVLLRGLARRPEDRFPSMGALLDALRADPGIQRRRWLPALAVVGAVTLAIVAYRTSQQQIQSVCAGAPRKLTGVWDDARRSGIRSAILASGKPYAADVAATVERAFDGYAGAWTTMHVDACEATHLRHEQSQELLDLRMACLGNRLTQFRALGDVYLHADAAVVERAAQAAQSLPTLDGCADVGTLRAPMEVPTDPAARAEVARVRDDLARARALGLAAQYEEGIRVATAATESAASLAYRPLQAEAYQALGILQSENQQGSAGGASYHAALAAALAGRHDEIVVEAATGLVAASRYQSEHFVDGHRWVDVARAALERLPPEDVHWGQFYGNLGSLLDDEGHYQEALAEYRKALALRIKTRGPDHPGVASILNNMAIVHDALAEYDEALAEHRRAYEIRVKSFGPDHPLVAVTWNNISTVLCAQGKYEEARVAAERSLQIKEKVFGPEHPDLAYALNTLGAALLGLGRYDEALVQSQRALTLRERSLGPDDPAVGIVLDHIGAQLLHLHRYEEALARFRRAYAIREKRLGPEHPDLAYSLHDIGSALLGEQKYDQALASLRRSVALREAKLGKDHPGLVAPLSLEGQTYLALGAADRAIEVLERALVLALADPRKIEPATAAEVRFQLGRALDAAHGDAARALVLATEARRVYATCGAAFAEDVGTVDRWLAARRR